MDFRVKFSLIFVAIFLFSSHAYSEPKPQKVVNVRPYNIIVDLKNQVDELNGTVNQLQSQLAQNTAALDAVLERVSANEENIENNQSNMTEIFNLLAMGDVADLRRDMEHQMLKGRVNELQYRLDTAEGVEDLCTQTILLGETINGVWDVECQATDWYHTYARYYVFQISETKNINIELVHGQEGLVGLKLSHGNLRYGEEIVLNYSTNGSSLVDLDLAPGFYLIEVFSGDTSNLQNLDFTLTVQ